MPWPHFSQYPRGTVPYLTVPDKTFQYLSILYITLRYFTIHYTIPYHTVRYHTLPYLYYTIPHREVLYLTECTLPDRTVPIILSQSISLRQSKHIRLDQSRSFLGAHLNLIRFVDCHVFVFLREITNGESKMKNK